jgi:hypothetical protein
MRMASRRLIAVGAALLGLLAASFVAVGLGAPVDAAASTALRNAELTSDGAWSWYQDPRAVHYVGRFDRTYIGAVDSVGDVEVMSQDAGTAVTHKTILHPALQADDHAAPAIEILPSGTVVVFYSAHVGSKMYFRVSSNPEDITSFGPEQTMPENTGAGGFTYANPFYLSSTGRTYLFFRGSDFRPAMTWTTDFVHWAPAQVVIDPLPSGLVTSTRPYVKYATNGVDTISMSFTDGHPRDVTDNSIYSLTFKNGVLYAPNGDALNVLDTSYPAGAAAAADGVATGAFDVHWTDASNPSFCNPTGTAPLSTSTCTKLFNDGALVYSDLGHSNPAGEAWTISAAMDSSGNPVAVFATYADLNNQEYWYAHWTGSAWITTPFADAGGTISPISAETEYIGGADIVQSNPSTVYISREINPGQNNWEIEQWNTADGGHTFTHTEVTTNSVMKNARPVVPWGPPGDIKVLWMSGTYTMWEGNSFHMQIRELTSADAPTTTSLTTSASTIDSGQTVTLTSAVIQGVDGAPVPGSAVTLYGQNAAGGPVSVVSSVNSTSAGTATFVLAPTLSTNYFVTSPEQGLWGSSSTITVPIVVRRPVVASVSVTHSVSLRLGFAATIIVRARSAATGAAIAGARIELWQRTDAGTYNYVQTLVTNSRGLATVVRHPGSTVLYQARFTGTALFRPQASGPVRVAVVLPTVTAIAIHQVRSKLGAAANVDVSVRVSNTRAPLRNAVVHLYARVGTGPYRLIKVLRTNNAGIARLLVHPSKSTIYQARVVPTTNYLTATSSPAKLIVVPPVHKTTSAVVIYWTDGGKPFTL